MAPPRKRRRKNTGAREDRLPLPTLPSDLLLEIVARSDLRTLVRCAATCKLLRRDIQRAQGVVPRAFLACLLPRPPEPPRLSLVHPDVPAATFFSGTGTGHLASLESAGTDDLFTQYRHVTSRGGLILFRRRVINRRRWSERRSDLCVYDPMTGARTYLSDPPYSKDLYARYVLLTAADGVACSSSFLLLAFDLQAFYEDLGQLGAQTTGPSGTWERVHSLYGSCNVFFPWNHIENDHTVVLHGGLIHWLPRNRNGDAAVILSYDVAMAKAGSVRLPQASYCKLDQLHLTSSPDGKLLKLLAADSKFVISVWSQLPMGGGWTLEAAIHAEDKLRALLDHPPDIPLGGLNFLGHGEKSGVVLLQVGTNGALVVLDLETKEMRRQQHDASSLLFEVDLPSRLQAMKIFSFPSGPSSESVDDMEIPLLFDPEP